MKFLIIRFSSIGDIVLTSPVITAIKSHFPDAEIHFLTKKIFTDLLIHHPKITKIWAYEKGNLSALLKKLQRQNFDFVIDLHNNLRSHWVAFWLNKKTVTFHKENWKKWKMVFLKSKIIIPPVVDRYLWTLQSLNIPIQRHLKLEYYTGEESDYQAINILNNHAIETPFLCIVLSATHFTKKWPKEYYAQLIANISYPVILLGGKNEIEDSLWIENQLKNQKNVLNLCGKTSLNVSAAILKKSAWVITHDTGFMHIGCAFQKKMIVLWGNTSPEIGFSPYNNPQAINISMDLACKPCSKLGLHQCPKGHFHCMKKITPHLVLEKLNLFLA